MPTATKRSSTRGTGAKRLPKAASRARPTALEKLHRTNPNHGKLMPIDAKLSKWLGGPPLAPVGGSMVIPRPLDVDAAMRQITKGRLLTTSQLRSQLARAAGADAACPLCTGIFARMAAEAAEEERGQGRARITPYWRLVGDDGRLNPKLPGGEASQARLLMAEGWVVARRNGKGPLRVDRESKS